MIYRRESRIFKNLVRSSLKIPTKKSCEKSIYRVYLSYTENECEKKVKAMGTILKNKRQKTKLPELATFNFGELGILFATDKTISRW